MSAAIASVLLRDTTDRQGCVSNQCSWWASFVKVVLYKLMIGYLTSHLYTVATKNLSKERAPIDPTPVAAAQKLKVRLNDVWKLVSWKRWCCLHFLNL